VLCPVTLQTALGSAAKRAQVFAEVFEYAETENLVGDVWAMWRCTQINKSGKETIDLQSGGKGTEFDEGIVY